MDVRKRLRLDPLRGVDDEDRSLARLEAAADLVAEVDVAGRVDQVERVALAVTRVVLQAHRARLDRYPFLALEIHRVEYLARHLARLDRMRQLEQPVGERRLPMVDMGDDRKVAHARLGDHSLSIRAQRLKPTRLRVTGGSRVVRARARRVVPFCVAPRRQPRASRVTSHCHSERFRLGSFPARLDRRSNDLRPSSASARRRASAPSTSPAERRPRRS